MTKIGIIGAMYEEVDKLIAAMTIERSTEKGKRVFHEGRLYQQSVVIVFSRWGKVAAAATTAQLIVEFGVEKIIFMGVAGAVDPTLHIGDVVIARRLFQHDMDARPMMPQFEIPLIGQAYFECKAHDIRLAQKAAIHVLSQRNDFYNKLESYAITSPKVVIGDIASGDKFVSTQTDRSFIQEKLPSVVCVEMEGAAVAQVASDFDIPFLIIRTISDTADDASVISFPVFVENIASEYSLYILKELLCDERFIG